MNAITPNRGRLLQLLKNELFSQYKTILLITGCALISAIVLSWFFWMDDRNAIEIEFPLLLLLGGGLVFSGIVFSELHNPSARNVYLSLPCSVIEKYLSKFLMSGVLYFAYTLIVYFIYISVSEPLFSLIYSTDYQYLEHTNMPGDVPIGLFGIFIVYTELQSLLLLGGVYFRSKALPKTVVVAFVFFVLLLVSTSFLAFIINTFFPLYIDGNPVVLNWDGKLLQLLEVKLGIQTATVYWLIILMLLAGTNYVAVKALQEQQA